MSRVATQFLHNTKAWEAVIAAASLRAYPAVSEVSLEYSQSVVQLVPVCLLGVACNPGCILTRSTHMGKHKKPHVDLVLGISTDIVWLWLISAAFISFHHF